MGLTAPERDLEVEDAVVGGRDGVGEAGGYREGRIGQAPGEQARRSDHATGLLIVGEVNLDHAVEPTAIFFQSEK